jgi:MFS family permease
VTVPGTPAPAAAPASRRRVVTALGIVQILTWGSTYYLLAVLAEPIVASTGWRYGLVIGGISFGLLVSGLVSIRVGRAIERLGGRPVLAASTLMIAAGLLVLAVAPRIEVYFAAWLLLGIGMGGGLYDAAFSTLGRIYGRDARGAITAVTLWGGFASTVCWPLSAFLVETVGWRGACLTYAGIHLAVTLPLLLLALPRERVRVTRADAEPGPRASASSARRTRLVFILLAVILTTGGAIAAAVSVHLIAMLRAGGLSLAAAVSLGALVGPAQVGARIIEMLVGRHYHPIWTLAAAACLITTGVAALWLGFPIPALALIAYGAGNGIWSIARGAVPLALFGPSGYAVRMGRLAMPTLLAQAAAPSAGGVLMAAHGAGPTLAVLAGLASLNVVSIVLLWPLTRGLRRAVG